MCACVCQGRLHRAPTSFITHPGVQFRNVGLPVIKSSLERRASSLPLRCGQHVQRHPHWRWLGRSTVLRRRYIEAKPLSIGGRHFCHVVPELTEYKAEV